MMGVEIGIIAIAVGYMVGKAVRAGSRGLGGRPQQILAVLLTYFSITTSYVAVGFYQMAKNPQQYQHSAKKRATSKRRPDRGRATQDRVGGCSALPPDATGGGATLRIGQHRRIYFAVHHLHRS
jgi:hypothetical protein